MPRTVEYSLGRSPTANLASKMGLGAGCGAAIWENQNDRVRYDEPNNHTFSLYLKGGTGTSRLDARKISGWPGAVCIMPSGHSSEWEITSPFRFVHLYVSDEKLRRMFSEIHDCDARRFELPEANFVDKPRVAQPLSELARALVLEDTLQAESALAGLVGLLPKQEVRFLGGLAPHVLRRVEEYVEAYLATSIHLCDLASLANMSEFHFHRMFRLMRGCPPHTWITGRRVDRAKHLLRSDMPVAQIADLCGFSSQSHLTRTFHQQTGRTPAKFRRLLQNH
jgi:AraC family transcriptional regulator